jgi:hypothetical protein
MRVCSYNLQFSLLFQTAIQTERIQEVTLAFGRQVLRCEILVTFAHREFDLRRQFTVTAETRFQEFSGTGKHIPEKRTAPQNPPQTKPASIVTLLRFGACLRPKLCSVGSVPIMFPRDSF